MVSLRSFLDAVAAIVASNPAYSLGHDGSDGLCDCVGLIIGAIRRAGGKWTGVHGSNWAARNAVADLRHDRTYKLGWAVFKAKTTDLPAAYANHPDQLNYYHVGVVTGVDPLEITHCTSWSDGGGIKVDTVPGAWEHSGRLTDVTDETAQTEVMQVTAESGNTVNLRSSPAKHATIVARVPVGSSVVADASSGDWKHISYDGKTGWMMGSYLYKKEDDLSSHIAALESVLSYLRSLQET